MKLLLAVRLLCLVNAAISSCANKVSGEGLKSCAKEQQLSNVSNEVHPSQPCGSTNASVCDISDGIRILNKTLQISGNEMEAVLPMPLPSNLSIPCYIEFMEIFGLSIDSTCMQTLMKWFKGIKLIRLSFCYCSFDEDFNPEEDLNLSQFATLTHFVMASSKVTIAQIKRIISVLPQQLEYLDLSCTCLEITKPEIFSFPNLKQLKEIHMESCRLNVCRGTSFVDFAFRISSLEILNLDSNCFVIEYVFTKLKQPMNLVQLNLSACPVFKLGNAPIENLAQQSKLQHLYMPFVSLTNKTTSKLIAVLAQMQRLKFVDVRATNLTEEQYLFLLDSNPNMTVYTTLNMIHGLILHDFALIKRFSTIRIIEFPTTLTFQLKELKSLVIKRAQTEYDFETIRKMIEKSLGLKSIIIESAEITSNLNYYFYHSWPFPSVRKTLTRLQILNLTGECGDLIGIFVYLMLRTFDTVREIALQINSDHHWIPRFMNLYTRRPLKLSQLSEFSLKGQFEFSELCILFKFFADSKIEFLQLDVEKGSKLDSTIPVLKSVISLSLIHGSGEPLFDILPFVPNLMSLNATIRCKDDIEKLQQMIHFVPHLRTLELHYTATISQQNVDAFCRLPFLSEIRVTDKTSCNQCKILKARDQSKMIGKRTLNLSNGTLNLGKLNITSKFRRAVNTCRSYFRPKDEQLLDNEAEIPAE